MHNGIYNMHERTVTSYYQIMVESQMTYEKIFLLRENITIENCSQTFMLLFKVIELLHQTQATKVSYWTFKRIAEVIRRNCSSTCDKLYSQTKKTTVQTFSPSLLLPCLLVMFSTVKRLYFCHQINPCIFNEVCVLLCQASPFPVV